MTILGFRERLATRQKELGSVLCVGLDPLPERLPACLRSGASSSIALDVATWMEEIVDATAPYTTLYKPQSAYWEAMFPDGVWAMNKVVRYIKRRYPSIPVFLDCKRGDIGRTQERYRIAHFDHGGVDGANFSPYMGADCMEYFTDEHHKERAIVGLCYTSNESGREPQDAIMANGRPYWEFIAELTLRWAQKLGVVDNAGLVMAAAYESPKGSKQIYSQHLRRIREIVSSLLWLLVPGYGTQGGFLAETLEAGFTSYGSMAISSSSDVIFASAGEDFAPAAATKARKAHEQMREIITRLLTEEAKRRG